MPEEQKRRQSEAMKAKWAARKAKQAQAQAKPEPDTKRKRDPRPAPDDTAKAKDRNRRKHDGDPGDLELERVLARIFTLPAVPAKMLLDCDFCAVHFATEGPKTAHELVELSRDHDQLRGVLLDLYRSYTNVTWIGIVLGYLARPIAHHLAPDGFLAYSYPVLGVPPRAPYGGAPTAAGRTNGAAAPAGGDPVQSPPAAPFPTMPDFAEAAAAAQATVQGMSDEQVREMAENMGLDVSAIIGADATVTSTDQAGPDPAGNPGPPPADSDPESGE